MSKKAAPDILAALFLVVISSRWITRLTSYLVNDDEGSYLYAAWRVSLGERPYCDFLTPQLPGFLLPGGALMRLTGPEVWPARALAVAAALLAGILVWATARRLFGPWVALIAGSALLLHPDVFEAGRTFRSDPFMLFLQTAGVYVFARAVLPRPDAEDPPNRRLLAVTGAIFGLATLTKLFGPLPLGGLLLWLLYDGRQRGRPTRAMVTDGAAALIPCGAVAALGLGAFQVAGCDIYTATIGHHGMQNASADLFDVLGGGLRMLGIYVRDSSRAVPAAIALAVAIGAWRDMDRRAALIGWQFPTALALLVLSRDRFPRHLLYLAPAIATLFGLGVFRISGLGHGGRARDARLSIALSISLAAAVLGAWWLFDRDYIWSRNEDGTQRVADFISMTTMQDDIVLSDYSELNFYARRPTTYSAASLSSGAAQSGQISWARIRSELDEAGQLPALIVREIDSPYSHLAQLWPDDLAAFESWVAERYVRLGTLQRDAQKFEVFAPVAEDAGNSDASIPVRAEVGDELRLLAVSSDRESAASGDTVNILSAWAARSVPQSDYVATVRLMDGDGRVWAQSDDALRASGERTTLQWSTDELTSLRTALDIPMGLPPGHYDMMLGVYRREDLSRMTILDKADGAMRSSLSIGALDIEPWQPGSADVVAGVLGLENIPISVRAAEADTPSGGVDLVAHSKLIVSTEDGTGAVEAGTLLPIELAWRAVEKPQDVSARVTLVDPKSGAVAADHVVMLGVAGSPSSKWPQGTIARQRLGLPVLGNAAEGDFVLSVTSVIDEGASQGAPLEIGRVHVTARDLTGTVFHIDEGGERFDIRFGDVAQLVRADLGSIRVEELASDDAEAKEAAVEVTLSGDSSVGPTAPSVQVGDALEVTLVWRALSPSEWPYVVSVQLLGADGRPIAQSDQPPTAADGTPRTTIGWIPGEIILDQHIITIPSDTPAGIADLFVVLYRGETGRRLPVRLDSAESADAMTTSDIATIGQVIILR